MTTDVRIRDAGDDDMPAAPSQSAVCRALGGLGVA
jgi:hypothetical protein